MRDATLALLRCPSGCEAVLEAQVQARDGSGAILQGTLCCSECGHTYRIEEGIARLLPGGGEAPAVTDQVEAERKRSEMQARDAQVEDYDKMKGLALFGKIEIPVTLRMTNPQRDDVLLEAGCGTGRMTPTFAAQCRDLVSADFSFESLKVCRQKLLQAGIRNVDLIQADVCALPVRTESFQRVISCQVLEHIPTPQSRSRMIQELARSVKPGGRVVISAYQHSIFTRMTDKKEGEHPGGIYYYRFGRAELRSLLSEALTVEKMTGALVYHYLARCRKS